MANYNQGNPSNISSHFSRALFGEAERSRMKPLPTHYTTFNAGDIVPIYCREILPEERLSLSLADFVIRQNTLLTPTMGQMKVDFYAFFVPNRVVNTSFKAVMGENFSGSWTANTVSLAPLVNPASPSLTHYSIPVGSVADYYGFPTQSPLPVSVLSQCHDLKFRGYVAIYNEYFRDQNYQPPIPISYLNVYQGFLDSSNRISIDSNGGSSVTIPAGTPCDGSFPLGSVSHAIFGSGSARSESSISATSVNTSRFKAINPPLKANKLHDYFTSVLPSPQKSQSPVFAPVSGSIKDGYVVTASKDNPVQSDYALLWQGLNGDPGSVSLGTSLSGNTIDMASSAAGNNLLYPSNLVLNSSEVSGLEISVDDLRMAAAIQQCYEILARGGSRYRSIVQSFFGVDVDDPFDDIPKCLGHLSRDLQLFQTAQTSASQSGSTPQGNLAGFGYTASSGELFREHRFLEHGYLHVFAIVRHRNIYSSYLARDNFRLNMLDFYLPPLANISEQPVYTREINPFAENPNDAFGYQEAWAEYRFEPDMVSGYMRPGVDNSLSLWNYADDFDASLQIADGEWLKSNSQAVLDRSSAVTSAIAPQFKASFTFAVDKELPMPTYSVPGLDII
ncbi:major capsid protein [Peromfec virus RodF8_38]|uniref:Major capsid protein n=1 Tax=Peromfec virus RodF8_38 TaxID=2929373 RepID=A0A976R8S5_9VIRU|nr:major capsid protein [Peromfec virus RodF8_38]